MAVEEYVSPEKKFYVKAKVLFEKNYTTVELNIFVTMQLRANLRVPAERP